MVKNDISTTITFLHIQWVRQNLCVELVDVKVGDAVFCKVKGNMVTHLVTALQGGVDNRRIQISNNHGHVNGWTTTIYGRVTEIEP